MAAGKKSNKRTKVVGTALLSALIVGGISSPAYADPGSKIKAVPDAGSRPVPLGMPSLPTSSLGLPVTLPTTQKDALKLQIDAAAIEVEVLGEDLLSFRQQHEDAVIAKAMADYAWRLAADALRITREKAEQVATGAYRGSAELPPNWKDTFGDLEHLNPRPSAGLLNASEAAARDLAEAEAAEKATFASLTEATTAEKLTADVFTAHEKVYRLREAALELLKKRMADIQSEEDRQREHEDDDLGDSYDPGQSNNGKRAHPKAQQAVRYALAQRGDPYVFAEEGPDAFDCSGLIWAGYRTSGTRLPRVSRDMYQGTKAKTVSISLSALLPGDLVFWATDPSNPRTIHHVALYIGNGKIVQASTRGTFVHVKKLNLSSVDFATRVVDAVTVVTPGPSPTRTNSPTPAPSVTATTSAR